jgi:chromate reductase, NAD(P)H dehydrogenase (quinone)
MDTHRIAVLVGSLRTGSYNRKLALTLQEMARPHLDMTLEPIENLPLYNEDLEHGQPPAAWVQFRQRLRDYDGVLFVTPEYNRSMPGALKNAIDIGSRPYGSSVWDGKPAAVISGSVSSLGGFGANHHLRQSLVFLNMPCMQQPEAYIGNAAKLFDDQGRLRSDDTAKFLRSFVDGFANWVHHHAQSAVA